LANPVSLPPGGDPTHFFTVCKRSAFNDCKMEKTFKQLMLNIQLYDREKES